MKKRIVNGIASVMAIPQKLPNGFHNTLWFIGVVGDLGGMASWATQTIKLIAW